MNSRRFGALAAVCLLALLGAACAKKKPEAVVAKLPPTTTTTTTAPAPAVLAPLTGVPTRNPAMLRRPALVVKIDNADGKTPLARPQAGITQADVVYEEKVEGSVSRLLAVIHSLGSDPLGPIRSARTTDVAIIAPLRRPLYAWSGANPDFARIIRSSPLIDVGYDAATGAYTRRNAAGHKAPHNLYSSTTKLFALAPADATPPAPLFTYRAAGTSLGEGEKPVRSIHLDFGVGGAPVDWRWDGMKGVFRRTQLGTPHVDEAGRQVAPANVIVQFVNYRSTGYTDVSGASVPEAELVGSGHVWVLSGGRLVEGTWTKANNEAVTTFTDASGKPIGLAPGKTWVELAPPGAATFTG